MSPGAAGWGRRPTAQPVNVLPKDRFPTVLLDFLHSLPSEDRDGGATNRESGRRPAKRQKVEPEVEAIPILSEEVVISRPRNESVAHDSFHRDDVLSYLEFMMQDAGTAGRPKPLVLFSKSYPGMSSGMALAMRSEQASNTAAAILAFAASSGKGRDGASTVWASASVSLERTSHVNGQDTLKVFLRVFWNASMGLMSMFRPRSSYRNRLARTAILQVAFANAYASSGPTAEAWSPQDFYEAAHVPSVDDLEANSLHVPDLTCTPYPFQRRAIQWLLNREGVHWSQSGLDCEGRVQPVTDVRDKLPLSFFETRDAAGRACFVSPIFDVVTRDIGPFLALEEATRGGILAEEMGLGKTVEIISLILLHRRPFEPPRVFDPYTGTHVISSPGTLIVAPTALKDQWISEIRRHAPTLDVTFYDGIGRKHFEQDQEEAFVRELSTYDVVVTTYSVLTAELDYAIPPPERARRAARKYHRPKSPLVQISWWRVCMDEAQMIESGVSKSATVARMIPRVNAWGVTGTPVRDKVDDLYGLLLFLRHDPYASVKPVWQTLVESRKDIFRELFNRLALRHTKKLVKDELTIPRQKRYVITMPFTAVEEQHYQSLFKELAESCGLNTQGEPIENNWDPEDTGVQEAMRTALDRLRKTALHPEIGIRRRDNFGQRTAPMRTVAEVLDAMIEQSEAAIRVDQRTLLSARLKRGQMLENSPRVKEALAIWQDVLRESQETVSACRAHLQKEVELSELAKESGASNESDTGSEDAEETVSARVGEARTRLRSALEIEHKATFFCANAYYQIKTNADMTEPESDEYKRLEELETSLYERAKVIRKEILQEAHRKATALMKLLSNAAATESFVEIPELQAFPHRGIETRHIVDSLEELCGVLNDQASQLDDWREEVIQLLLKPLVDEEDDIEITGEEYEDSTKLQEEIMVRIQVLRAAVSDRTDSLLGTVNTHIQQEAARALRQANDSNGPYPEKLLELHQVRLGVKPDRLLGSFRGSISELRGLSTKLKNEVEEGSKRAVHELEIVTKQLQWTQHQFLEHQKVSAALDKEIDRFTATENARTEYYRQLQDVSDMVAPYEGPKDDSSLPPMELEEDNLRKKVSTAESKYRYLLHLKDADRQTEEQRLCVICRDPFNVGVLTVCGHQFCKECIMTWFKAHHNCPVCKRQLHASNLHDITLKPQELKVHSETPAGGDPQEPPHSPGQQSSSIYSQFSAEKLAEIKDIDLEGPVFTTKIDTLVRHLLWLRESDPGAKSIIFSQYHDFLKVLSAALEKYRIGFASFDKPSDITKFKEDPSVECFLLHARAHASGLNLVNANHVFLCEPLVNTALELQAIARVHRIGQEHETTVWLYIVDGTVEESIYNLSVQRRLEHMERSFHGRPQEPAGEVLDANLEVANSMELEQASLSKLMAKGKVAGEAVDQGDLWQCLFGHVKRVNEAEEERLRSNPEVRSFLAGEAAEQRREVSAREA